MLAACLLPCLSRADAILDVSGASRLDAKSGRLVVRVTLTNRGDRRAGPIEVKGELAGERRHAQLASVLAPGAQGTVELDFAPAPPQPGLHALTLLVEHPLDGPPDAAANPPTASQRAFLLLALGENPGEAVRIEAAPLELDVRASLAVRLSSRDGERHLVRLRALTARGLRSDAGPLDVEVPARGEALVSVEVVRAGAPRGSRQALLLVAETPSAPLARTSVAAVSVAVMGDPALLPRLRKALLAAGLALVVLALGFEAWTRTHGHSRGASSA